MKMNEMKVRLTLTDEILGTAPNDKEIYANYIGSNAPDAPTKEQEIEAVGVEEVIEKSTTVFPRDKNGNPIMWDYQLKGMVKDAVGMLRNVPGTCSKKLTNYKKKIDGLVFIKDRENPFIGEINIGYCQRPLRGQTAQGERISLANSETLPAGTQIEFTFMWFEDEKKLITRELFEEILDYGRVRGLGQWRNSGKGRFTWEEVA